MALQVGPLKKGIRVVGERTWFKSMGRISTTKPLPFEKMPLTWERAFGGWDRTNAAESTFEPRNPVGTGFRASPRNFEEGLRLPNLEDPSEPLRELGQRVMPVGFGFTSPEWQPRAKFAGTYDEAWSRERKPLLPKDFLPGQVAPVVTVEQVGAEDVKPEMRLDTVILDTDEEQVLLLWRGHVVLSEGVHDVRGLRITAEAAGKRA